MEKGVSESKDTFTDIFVFSFVTSFCLLFHEIECLDRNNIDSNNLENIRFSQDLLVIKNRICFDLFKIEEPVKNGLNSTLKIAMSNKVDFNSLFNTSINNLLKLEEEFNTAIQRVLLKSIIVLQRYDSRIKTCLKLLSYRLYKNSSRFILIESVVSQKLNGSLIQTSQTTVQDSLTKRWTNTDIAKIGGASILGGLIVGLTGGLAAPAIGVGLGTMGASLGVAPALVTLATAQSTVMAATAVFALSGATVHGYKMSKRLSKSVNEFFIVENKTMIRRLSVYVSIHGWVSNSQNIPSLIKEGDNRFNKEFNTINIVWERKINAKIGSYFKDLAFDQTLSLAVNEAIKHTALSALFAAFSLPGYALKLAQLIDNPWTMSVNKARAVGKELAMILKANPDKKIFGQRPISFYSYSTGCVAVYECLLELALDGSINQGIIENVIFVGAPIVFVESKWRHILPFVSGKIVNCYSSKDWVLSLIYRSSSNFAQIAGLGAINMEGNYEKRVLNIDVSNHGIKLHSEYENSETQDKIKEIVFSKLEDNFKGYFL